MRTRNIINTAAFAAGICVAIPSYANDIWQFTVTNDQNGPGWNCNEMASIPCSITNKKPPYILGTLTISAPLTGYATSQSMPITVAVDDNHLISFVGSSAVGLSLLNWPPAVATDPLVVNISVNEVNGTLSGSVYLDWDDHGSAAIIMTGMGNLWTGYWRTWDGNTHQFWAKSDKVLAIAQH